MWDFVLNLISTAVASAFSWFAAILNAAPGAWDSIFTVFVILALCRFLLAPLVGASFTGGSDTVSAKISGFRQQRRSDFINKHKDSWDTGITNR